MNEPTWPSYQTYTKDHLHAIGTLITQWNMVEWAIERLFNVVLGTNDSSSELIFNSLHNSARFDLLRDAANSMNDSFNAECLKRFVKHCSICNANRNIITHAKYFNSVYEDEIIALKNRDKDHNANLYAFSLTNLRLAADQTHETERFGSHLCRWLQTSDKISEDVRSFLYKGLDEIIKPRVLEVERPSIPSQPNTLSPLPHPEAVTVEGLPQP